MEVKVLVCPNCGASVSFENSRNYICPYCDSTLYIDHPEQSIEKKVENNTVKKIVIPNCCKEKGTIKDKFVRKSIDGCYKIIRKTTNAQDLITKIKTILDNKKETTTDTWMVDDYNKVLDRIQNQFEPEENLIFFKTAAVFNFNKLKTGMVVTDQRVGYLSGKNFQYVLYKDLRSIRMEHAYENSIYWYPNAIEDIFISALGVENTDMCYIIAYIIMRSYEENNGTHKVELSLKKN